MALIEMNMAYHYPSIYWNCACLTINASANEEADDNKSTNYGKIAKAIGDMQHRGIKIALPDINTARFGFSPDKANNQIIFGLKGINSVGDDIVSQIIASRPYASLADFCSKNAALGPKIVINLIKAGCFDSLQPDRIQAMSDYIVLLSTSKVQSKSALTMQNFPQAYSLGIVPQSCSFEASLTNFRKYIFSSRFQYQSGLYLLDDSARLFFENRCQHHLQEGKHYLFTQAGLVVVKKEFDRWYVNLVQPLKAWITSPQAAQQYTAAARQAFANEIWQKYCAGSISSWEMDSLCFYYHPHELAIVDTQRCGISDFSSIPAEPVAVEHIQRTNKATGQVTSLPKYRLYKIAGTVLDKNANKNSVTLLTTTGTVTVKFYAGTFSYYDKQISDRLPGQDKKTILEKSWFQRGNKLLVTGIRRGDLFYPKRYSDSIYQHTVCLIRGVNPNGTLDLQFERRNAHQCRN